MEFKKNDVLTVEITDMGHDGEGIGKVDGYTLFVKDALIKDTAEVKIMKAKKNYAYARLMHLVTPSPDRCTPRCEFACQCGGCQIQALSYPKQLAYKERKILQNLQRIGGFAPEEIPFEPIIGMEDPFHYRNKAQFPVSTDREGRLITGFYAAHTHTIINSRECLLGMPGNKIILDKILGFMEENNISAYQEETGSGLVRHILIRYGYWTKEWMVCLILNGRKLPGAQKLVESLCEIPGMTSITLNVNRERTNVIMGPEVLLLWGKPYIEDYIGDIKYQISPLSFYQVNSLQTRNLYQTALDYAQLTGEETVWDLYCGIGTISLFLARRAKQVYGVEIVPQAIADAKHNAQENGIENADFFVGKAEEVLLEKYKKESIYADVIVVDPPRKGCDEVLLETMVKMAPKRIVYVSCDSATLARDLKYLCGQGYQMEEVRGVDMFPQTVHVECVVLMSKVQK